VSPAAVKSIRKSDDKDKEEAAAPPKKSKKKLFIILGVVVLLLGGCKAKSILMAPHYKPGQKVPLGKTLPLDQMTVNLSDGHLVQTTIVLQLTSVAAPKSVSGDVTRFEDAAITVLGGYNYKTLLSDAGRTQMRAAYLAACQKIAGTTAGAAQKVAGVYFTSFIIQ
jgi:flagellar FliL protein